MSTFSILFILILVFTWLFPTQGIIVKDKANQAEPLYLFLFIGDGMGENHVLATSKFTSISPPYQSWFKGWVSTYPYGGAYFPTEAWENFNWVKQNTITDSASAATAIFSGNKTTNSRLNISPDGSIRYQTITEEARQLGLSVGVVTSVPISHATPGAWIAHNDSRNNGYAIANEGIWGNPNTTGESNLPFYGGAHGNTFPPIDVLIGGGHPKWYPGNPYIDPKIYQKLLTESDHPDRHRFVERLEGYSDGGLRLLSIANDSNTRKLVGLFGGAEGNLEFRLADGSGRNQENPTLPEMTLAAIQILSRNPNGFILLVEGGAIDFASHRNNLNETIGEVIDFNEAVKSAVDWVDNPTSLANWKNTLIIVTADHETGYLTQAPGVFSDMPLGEISPRTLQLEKNCLSTCLRASWEDTNENAEIDPKETVYWAWNSSQHTNSLVPIYLFGKPDLPYSMFIKGVDPIRGEYIDNTDIYAIMSAFLHYKAFIYLPLILQ